MPFPVEASVFVRSLRCNGQIVEAARGGRYRVRVGGVVISCREDDLEEPARTAKKDPRRKAEGRTPHGSPRDRHGPTEARPLRGGPGSGVESVDLHGLTVEEALSKVEERLDAALRAGAARLDIIHGRGSGRIKNAVQKYLRDITAVRRFALAPDNPGVTQVWL